MNILISAVGGQGALLASRILGKLAQNIDMDVKVSEVHGMSQRGGSVVTYVKFDKNVYSPLVEKGNVDIIIAFEMLEGARYVDWLKKDGTLIISNQKIDPMPVITGAIEYPENLSMKLAELPINFYNVNALELARKAGNAKAVNVVLIGVLAASTNIEKEKWHDAIKETVPEKLIDMNLKAFELGYETNKFNL